VGDVALLAVIGAHVRGVAAIIGKNEDLAAAVEACHQIERKGLLGIGCHGHVGHAGTNYDGSRRGRDCAGIGLARSTGG